MVRPRPDEQRTVELAIERRPGRGLRPALAAAAIIIGTGLGGGWALLASGLPPTGEDAARTVAPTTPAARPEPQTLREQAAADQAAVRQLVGRWVPQLAADAARGPDETRIWSRFRALHARHPEVLLLRSDDYRSFTRPGYWVAVLGREFDSATAVNAWCDRQGFRPDDCFAKRLSPSGGPRGNTVARR